MQPENYQDLASPLEGQVYQVAHSATAARYQIPPQWRGKYVTFTSAGADLSVVLGGSNVKIESAEVAVAASEVLAPNWASGALVPAGVSSRIAIPLDPAITHFCVDSSQALGADDVSGSWSAYVNSGYPTVGEDLNVAVLGQPLLWLDAGKRDSLNLTAGAITVTGWHDRANNYTFSESSTKPDLLDAAAAGAGMLRPVVSFVAGSSEKLACTDATLAGLLGANNSFTLAASVRRGATGAVHTIMSVGTSGAANGHWDLSINASEDLVMTRVDASGNSATATYAATLNTAYSFLLTYDGATNVLYVDGTAVTFTASGTFATVGTPTHAVVGSRFINVTYDQYATMELADLVIFPECFTGSKLANLQAWLRRRTGK